MEHLQSLQKAKGFTANGIFFSFLFFPPICCRAQGQKAAGLAPGGAHCWKGKKELHCCRAGGAGPSTPLALTTQTPASALAEGVVARVQHAPVSCLHALRWAASSWQIFKELEGMCCIPQGIMQCIINKRAQGSWASAALLQWGLIPCPAHREDKTCLPCLLLLGK